MSTEQDQPWHRFYPPGVSAQIPPAPFASIGEMVRATAATHGPRPAFSNLGTELSFTEVDELSDRFASFLQHELGLVKGDRIVLQMPNVLQYPVAMFAALKAGLVVVNANPLYTSAEMSRVLADAEPRALLALANFADRIEQALPGSSVEHVILTEVADLMPTPKRLAVNALLKHVKKMVPGHGIDPVIPFRQAMAAGSRRAFAPPEIAPEDTAFLQYTGGTTGGPKAAVLTHANLIANEEQFIRLMPSILPGASPRIIAALPLYHVFSLTVNCLGFFRFGAHNVLITNPRDIPAFVKTLRKGPPEGIILVNTLAAALLENEDFRALDFSRLAITVAGGMAVRTSVAARWKDVTGKDIVEGYGLTEASPVVSVNPVHMPPRPGTIGVPLPSTEVQVRGEDGQPVPAGEKGELAVRGPQVMRGYWNRPEETAEVLDAAGWLLTGDIATADADGFLTIVDRKKEIIVVSGFNVYPGEIEDAAMLHPKVAEAGVTGVPDERSGEAPKLFVVRRDESLTAEELMTHLREQLAGYKRPRSIEFREELPKSNVGKVLRRELA
ncbi:AMP-binding protein [Sediminivirga luteola]|uniref:Long-chain-fatty-acid--CoA ligase n=1 Tax=Sediminivirga luteola TaxID=1774748 RepID=A0A8J2TY84_9MICO|nr:AMP-binding protein [Sediminivirga luteola]MCI2265822.1 AMP-binding protein [Sediminivirga luteola]GGA14369.1 long-chain-fatty-acid--CoA ligase [Sediminivirga luteola]